MTIAEPMTMLTDYVLAGVAGWLGLRLFRARAGQAARSSWALAFAALAVAALLGGTYHGFAPHLAERTLGFIWTATVLAAGVASFGMLAGSVMAATAGSLRTALLAFAAAKLAIYAGWMLNHDAFIYVIADTGATMAALTALHVWSAIRKRDRASPWMLGGVGVSVLAAAVQASGFALHRHFNHNDLYHLIQIAALVLLYVGATRLHDRGKHRACAATDARSLP
jgi:hypothetical protein